MKTASQYLLAWFGASAILGSTGCGGSHYTRDRDITLVDAGKASGRSVVAIERVYGDLVAQMSGPAVRVTTILNSPSADPHSYEPTARDADAIASADVVIENGLGYDAFADKLIAASPRAGRVVIDVGALRHKLGDNPHVWYEPQTLAAFVDAYYATTYVGGRPRGRPNARFAGVSTWIARYAAHLHAIGVAHARARIAITEPVFDYVLRAANLTIATPTSFSHAIEEGNDPAPQDVDTMQALLGGKHVAAFVYNEQTVEPATTRLLRTAQDAGVHVVPVTETLPDNMSTQKWIDGEVSALEKAL